MKILLIQLARPGDIYSTKPVLSALRRQYPEAEIHFLVRQKFAPACAEFKTIDHLWTLDSKKILAPLMEDCCKVNESLNPLRDLVTLLQKEMFDKVINLTFSPASSFLTHLIAQDGAEVRGYTRSVDFFLYIPDEASQYFRSQVGIHRSNRIHLYDLFAMVAGVELQSSDIISNSSSQARSGIVCHTGASQAQKTWPTTHWAALFTKLSHHKITIVGGKDDLPRVQEILSLLPQSTSVENLVGQTSFDELGKIIAGAELFIGADSGPIHVANSVGTPILNLSVGAVNFWETGPTVKGSQVLVSLIPSRLTVEEVAGTAHLMLSKKGVAASARYCDGQKLVRYDDHGLDVDPGWDTVGWLYFNGAPPSLTESQTRLAAQITEVCEIATQQVTAFMADQTKTQCLDVLVQTDEILKIIARTDRVLAPLLSHFFVQKENILPGPQAQVAESTLHIYANLNQKISQLAPAPEMKLGESYA